jgi:hypothetical protein
VQNGNLDVLVTRGSLLGRVSPRAGPPVQAVAGGISQRAGLLRLACE